MATNEAAITLRNMIRMYNVKGNGSSLSQKKTLAFLADCDQLPLFISYTTLDYSPYLFLSA